MRRWKKLIVAVMSGVMLFNLTACGGGSTDTASSGSGDGELADELNIYIWSEYIDEDVIKGFEDKYGITVNVTFFTSTDEMMAKLMTGGGSEYDLIQPGTSNIPALREGDYIQELDFSNIPNYEYVDDVYKNDYFGEDDNKYAVPYMAGTTVVAYNKNTCPIEITEFEDLLDPALAGETVCITSSQSIISMVLGHLGYEPNSTDEAEVAEASEFLQQLKPNIKVFDGDAPRKSLLNGECSVGILYGGDLAIAMAEQPDTFVVPEFASDDFRYGISATEFCVTKDAKHKTEAELFINWIHDPENYAKCLDTYPYISTNTKAIDYVGEEYKAITVYNLSDEAKNNSYAKKDLGDATVVYDEYWSKFMNQ